MANRAEFIPGYKPRPEEVAAIPDYKQPKNPRVQEFFSKCFHCGKSQNCKKQDAEHEKLFDLDHVPVTCNARSSTDHLSDCVNCVRHTQGREKIATNYLNGPSLCKYSHRMQRKLYKNGTIQELKCERFLEAYDAHDNL